MKKNTFSRRKKDHIVLSLKQENEAKGAGGFSLIQLMHSALPEMDFSEVDISTRVFGKNLATPFTVTGMTGGWEGSLKINRRIAKLCEKRGWIMGAGSQRRQIFDPSAGQEWQTIRKEFPNLTLLGNIGLSQLIKIELDLVEEIRASLKAEALVVHTNPLQEALQPEGTPQFKGGLKALARLSEKLSVPVILKETGSGFSEKTLRDLSGIGLFAVDVSGYGGTHWGRIEAGRIPKEHFLHGAGEAFKDWGISTVDSLIFARKVEKDYALWAGGGMRHGCDFAKALALGADRVGMAKPIMESALQGEEVLERKMARLEYELKLALFCCGCKNKEELQKSSVWRWKRSQ